MNIETFTSTRILFISSSRTTHYGLRQIKVLGAKIWNRLPQNIRLDNITIAIFSKELKRYLLEQAF